jgi:agmatinase
VTDGPRHVTTGDVVGPVDATKLPCFAGPPTFARLPRIDEVERADVTVHCADVELQGLSAAVDRMRERVGAVPIYVSVEVDVLDPAHAPGTGTPEAGGLTSRELLVMLRALADLDVVSADIVEVAPAYDHAELTGIAAAHIAYELLSIMPCKPRSPDVR